MSEGACHRILISPKTQILGQTKLHVKLNMPDSCQCSILICCCCPVDVCPPPVAGGLQGGYGQAPMVPKKHFLCGMLRHASSHRWGVT